MSVVAGVDGDWALRAAKRAQWREYNRRRREQWRHEGRNARGLIAGPKRHAGRTDQFAWADRRWLSEADASYWARRLAQAGGWDAQVFHVTVGACTVELRSKERPYPLRGVLRTAEDCKRALAGEVVLRPYGA